MTICPRCNANNPPNTLFCNRCGFQFTSSIAPRPPKMSNKLLVPLIVLGSLIASCVFCGMVGGIKDAFDSKKGVSNTPSVSQPTNSLKPAPLIATPKTVPTNKVNNSSTPIATATPNQKVKKNNNKVEKASEEESSLSAEDSSDDSSQTTNNDGYHLGPRGGCYYYGGTGRKVYVDRSLCSSHGGDSKKSSSSSSSGYIRGPRGGCYYITASGNKKYVDRRLCD